MPGETGALLLHQPGGGGAAPTMTIALVVLAAVVINDGHDRCGGVTIAKSLSATKSASRHLLQRHPPPPPLLLGRPVRCAPFRWGNLSSGGEGGQRSDFRVNPPRLVRTPPSNTTYGSNRSGAGGSYVGNQGAHNSGGRQVHVQDNGAVRRRKRQQQQQEQERQKEVKRPTGREDCFPRMVAAAAAAAAGQASHKDERVGSHAWSASLSRSTARRAPAAALAYVVPGRRPFCNTSGRGGRICSCRSHCRLRCQCCCHCWCGRRHGR